MSLGSFNITQEVQALNALFKSTASSVAPLLLLESFIMGVLCACVPIGSYMLWAKPLPFPRAPSISMLWIVLTATIVHWALSLRQLELTISGRSLGISVSFHDLELAVRTAEKFNITDMSSYRPQPYLDENWHLLPLRKCVAVLTSPCNRNGIIRLCVFAVCIDCIYQLSVCASRSSHSGSGVRRLSAFHSQFRSRGRSWSPLVIPTVASVMYALSLAHWAISSYCFAESVGSAATDALSEPDMTYLPIALMALLSLNAAMSDTIVLWRMCAVWERARPIVVFGAASVLTIFSLNIANIVIGAGLRGEPRSGITYNHHDSETFFIYGQTSLGLAAAFVSLASNLCATALVGLKIWLHRREFPMRIRYEHRCTMVERVMALLVDSGVVYTTIWLLYCISFYRPITSRSSLGPPSTNVLAVTAAGYLDAAMAQITSIYPLIVFILVALDKIHHSRGPRSLRKDAWPKERSPIEAVTVTFEIDIERSTMPNSDSAHPMAMRSEDDPGKVGGVGGGEEKHRALEV